MNIGDLWQEHRRFITTVVAGLFVLLIGWLLIDQIYASKSRALQADIGRYKAAQAAAALPAGLDVRKMGLEREKLQKDYESLVKSIAHVTAPSFRLEGVADPDLHYNAQIDRIRTGVLELAAIRNIDVDQRLGLPDAFPSSRADIEHYLRGLDVVESLISAAVAAERLYEAGIARIERIDIEKPDKPKTGDRKVPFTTALQVKMTVIGHPQAIDWFLRTFPATSDDPARQGRYLAIEEAMVRSLDVPPGAVAREKRGADPLDRNRVECRLGVMALAVNPEGVLR